MHAQPGMGWAETAGELRACDIIIMCKLVGTYLATSTSTWGMCICTSTIPLILARNFFLQSRAVEA